MERKLTHQENQLCWHINSNKRLGDAVRKEVLEILDTYVRARDRLKADEENPQTDQSQNRKVGTVPDSEIEMVPTKEGKLIPRPKTKAHQRKPSDGDQNSNLEKLPPFDSELADKLWDESPDIAFHLIAYKINSKIQQMEFFFSAGDDPNSDTENLRFDLGPKFPEKKPDHLVYWYLSIFLSGNQVDWLRGRCYHCKRFIINSDPRVKYCDSSHKDLYWRPRRREYSRKYMAKRRDNR